MDTFNRTQLSLKFTNYICSSVNLFQKLGNAKGNIFSIIASLGWTRIKRVNLNHFIALRQAIGIAMIVFSFTSQLNHKQRSINWLQRILEVCQRGCTDSQKLKQPTSFIITINSFKLALKVSCMKWQSLTIDINWTIHKLCQSMKNTFAWLAELKITLSILILQSYLLSITKTLMRIRLHSRR